MQLCSQSLREVIDSMHRISDERFKTFQYFISCELLRELTECVQYLQSLTPSIIHRDLKPENVLISDGNDGHFLKLCDFGLSKVHDHLLQVENLICGNENIEYKNVKSIRHTRFVGSLKYMAPEVKDSQKYNHLSDVYSLALIAAEIFQFGENVSTIRTQNDL